MSRTRSKTFSSAILDLLALFARAKPRQRPRPIGSAVPASITDEISLGEVRSPMPLTAEEAPYYGEMPLDHRGAPHVRSQLASFVAERAGIEAGRMKLFSFDDDINALHYIARFERAGLGHLAGSHRQKLAAHRAREAKAGRKFRFINPTIAQDCESEQVLQRMYGSPAEDRARILQFYRRCDERDAASRRGLPARYSRYDVV